MDNDSQKRLMLTLAICFALTTVYLLFFAPKPVPENAVADGGSAQVQAAAPATQPKPEATPAQPTAPAAAAASSSAAAPAEPAPPVKTVTAQTPLLHLAFSSQGAGLTQGELQGRKMQEQPKLTLQDGFRQLAGHAAPPGPQMDMAVPVKGQPLALAVGVSGGRSVSPQLPYSVEQKTAPNGATQFVFTGRQNGVEITKTIEIPKSSDFDATMTVVVKNAGNDPLAGDLVVHYGRGVQEGSETKASFLGGVGNESHSTCMVGDDITHKGPDGKEVKPQKGAINFFGVNQQYFLGAVYPLEGPREGTCVADATATGRTVTGAFPLQIAAGQSATYKFGVYIGPKDIDILRGTAERMKDYGAAASAGAAGFGARLANSSYPFLDKNVDFGLWAAICKVLLLLLKFFHGLIHNWGVAIVLLTVAIKLALVPLTHKQMVSAEAMKKLQPKVDELKKKYANDRERQNQEMMKLYQQEKVNPLGGCLPLVIQMPVWIALYSTLRNSFELYREPFISPLWMDLTYKDPTYLFPLALGVTMIITQRLQPQMMDAAQARLMTWIMPVFFTALMFSYPAGLTLYIFTNNLLSIAQQYGLRRYLEAKGVSQPRGKTNDRQPARKRSNP